jgi:hypothetical protein
MKSEGEIDKKWIFGLSYFSAIAVFYCDCRIFLLLSYFAVVGNKEIKN